MTGPLVLTPLRKQVDLTESAKSLWFRPSKEPGCRTRRSPHSNQVFAWTLDICSNINVGRSRRIAVQVPSVGIGLPRGVVRAAEKLMAAAHRRGRRRHA